MENKAEEPVIICHSPTRKDLKNTDEFVHCVNILKRECKIPIELRLIENTPHKECLCLKRESHILFDHLQGYFGVSSLEGLSQGLCVIAGLGEWNRRQIEEYTGIKDLPWVIANNGCLSKRLAGLIRSVETADEIGKHSRSFMENHWNPDKLAHRLVCQIEPSVKNPKNRQTPGAEKPSHCQRWDMGPPPKQ